MDLIINGHSDENQPKKPEFKKIGKPKKVDINKLPYNEQEKIRNFMDMTGQTEEPEIYAVEVEMDYKSLDLFPIDILGNLLKDALQENRFENAEKICEVIKKKNYTIEITEKLLTLQYDKNKKSI
jgi:hypothetical protein